MKKLKLITTITALGSIAAATPIVVTGCSSTTQDFKNITWNGKSIYPNAYDVKVNKGAQQTFKAEEFQVSDDTDTAYEITKITATSSDEKYVKIAKDSDTQFTATAVEATTSPVSVSVAIETKQGKKGTGTVKITVEEAPKPTALSIQVDETKQPTNGTWKAGVPNGTFEVDKLEGSDKATLPIKLSGTAEGTITYGVTLPESSPLKYTDIEVNTEGTTLTLNTSAYAKLPKFGETATTAIITGTSSVTTETITSLKINLTQAEIEYEKLDAKIWGADELEITSGQSVGVFNEEQIQFNWHTSTNEDTYNWTKVGSDGKELSATGVSFVGTTTGVGSVMSLKVTDTDLLPQDGKIRVIATPTAAGQDPQVFDLVLSKATTTAWDALPTTTGIGVDGKAPYSAAEALIPSTGIKTTDATITYTTPTALTGDTLSVAFFMPASGGDPVRIPSVYDATVANGLLKFDQLSPSTMGLSVKADGGTSGAATKATDINGSVFVAVFNATTYAPQTLTFTDSDGAKLLAPTVIEDTGVTIDDTGETPVINYTAIPTTNNNGNGGFKLKLSEPVSMSVKLTVKINGVDEEDAGLGYYYIYAMKDGDDTIEVTIKSQRKELTNAEIEISSSDASPALTPWKGKINITSSAFVENPSQCEWDSENNILTLPDDRYDYATLQLVLSAQGGLDKTSWQITKPSESVTGLEIYDDYTFRVGTDYEPVPGGQAVTVTEKNTQKTIDFKIVGPATKITAKAMNMLDLRSGTSLCVFDNYEIDLGWTNQGETEPGDITWTVTDAPSNWAWSINTTEKGKTNKLTITKVDATVAEDNPQAITITATPTAEGLEPEIFTANLWTKDGQQTYSYATLYPFVPSQEDPYTEDAAKKALWEGTFAWDKEIQEEGEKHEYGTWTLPKNGIAVETSKYWENQEAKIDLSPWTSGCQNVAYFVPADGSDPILIGSEYSEDESSPLSHIKFDDQGWADIYIKNGTKLENLQGGTIKLFALGWMGWAELEVRFAEATE